MSYQIFEITDKKSYAILKYVNQLAKSLACSSVRIRIFDWKNAVFQDSLIKHFHYSNSTYKIILPLICSSSKNYVTLHDILPRDRFKRLAFSALIYRIINLKSDKIIVHSNHAKKVLVENYQFINKDKIIIIPHGCLPTNVSRGEIQNLRKKYGIKSHDIVFIYIGYIKKSKGVILTIEAFNQLSNPNIRLLIIGKLIDKESKLYLKNVKSSRIKYYGFVSDKIKNELIKVSDTLVNFRMDSVGETSGSVLNMLEYGKPILGTRIGSNPEVIGKAGILCDMNLKSIQKTLEKFINNSKTRRTLSKNALHKRDDYSWEKLQGIYSKIFFK